MDYKKLKLTAINLDAKKSVTVIIDTDTLSRCQTENDVKKALDALICESKVFRKDDLPKLKYQGRKEIIEEWKSLRTEVERQRAEREETLQIQAKDFHSRYNLSRFLDAQESAYPIALAEIQQGRKRGHWIWYIFPQQKGLGHSYNSEYYGLDGRGEAKAYLQHPVLGDRLRQMCDALLYHSDKDIHYIMGSSIDVLKLKTSMQLFNSISQNDIFSRVLRTFF